ncbi:MAG TPA: PRC-barrel domain-containing protein [Stellaceae bacterium]|nr:PRC-barrel domain-containing protein [Stellaceae bacterium]
MKRLLTGSSVVLTIALVGAGVSAQTPQLPKKAPEAPAMGGEPQTKSGHAVIALRANEVALSGVTRASLIHNTTKALAQENPNLYGADKGAKAEVPETIGTLTAVWLDPAQKKVVAVSVDADSKTVELPWSKIKPIHQPHDEFQTTMTAQDVAAASQKQANGIDVQQSLIGRTVTDSSGKKIGTVGDVVAQAASGTLDYIVVNPPGPSLGASNAPQAVPWAKLKSISGDKSQSIVLALDDQQLAAMPVFSASKAQETEGTRAAGRAAGATEPPAP